MNVSIVSFVSFYSQTDKTDNTDKTKKYSLLKKEKLSWHNLRQAPA